MRGARILDAALEASIVGGFSRIGYEVRSRTQPWPQPDLSGRRILITGGTSGLGLAAARMATAAGASVAITGRDAGRLDDAADAVATAGRRPLTVVADASDLQQTREMFDQVVEGLGGLNVLVNNAGALDHRFHRTAQGFERTYAVHVLSPFLLTALAVPVVGRDGVIVTVSSGGMYSQQLDPDQVQMTEADYDGVTAYARAKRAQVALNAAWAQRYPQGPVFAAMHPGWADTPGVQDSLPTFRRVTGPILRTPEQGADTIVWLAAGDVPSGLFWLDRHPRRTVHLPWQHTDPADVERTFQDVAADAGVGALPVG